MKHYIATAFAASALLAAPAWAQDMPAPDEEQDSSAESAAQDEPAPKDEGEQIVSEAQQGVQTQPYVLTKTAKEDLSERAGIQEAQEKADEGAENGVVLVIGSARGTCANPAESKSFIQAKNLLSQLAFLDAKRQIAEVFYSNVRSGVVSAPVVAATPGTNESADEAVVAAKAAIAAKMAKLAELTAKLDEKEAEIIDGCSVSDLLKGALDGIVARINPAFDKEQVAAEKEAAKARIQAAIEEVRAELEAFKQVAEQSAKKVMAEYSSSFEQSSSMRIYGAKIIDQADSWDKDSGDYEVACAVVFSPKLQEEAYKAFLGQQTPRSGFEDHLSVSRWVNQNRDLLQTWVGSRQYTDKNGRIQIVGIGIADADVPNNMKDKNQTRAEAAAKQNAVFGLYSEVASRVAVEEKLVKLDDDTFSEEDQSTASKFMQQHFDRALSGLKPIGTVTRQIEVRTGKPIFVSVYTIDPALAKCADAVMEKSTVLANLGEKDSQRKRGTKDGLDASYNATKASKDAYNQAKAAAKSGADKETAARDTARQGIQIRGPQNGSSKPNPAAPAQPKQTREGVISGGAVDMDW